MTLPPQPWVAAVAGQETTLCKGVHNPANRLCKTPKGQCGGLTDGAGLGHPDAPHTGDPVPVSFQILPQRQLILFSYWGQVGLQESMDIVAEAAHHPDYQPWLRQLCDLSGVTGVERNFPKLLRMQAKILEDLGPGGPDMLVLFYAPTRPGQVMAHMAQKSWEGLNSVRVLIQESEVGVLDLLGLPDTDLASLRLLVD